MNSEERVTRSKKNVNVVRRAHSTSSFENRFEAERRNVLDNYLRTIPRKYRPLYQKVTNGIAGKRQVFKAICQHCVNYEDTSNRVRTCSSVLCPLWPYRPYQKERR